MEKLKFFNFGPKLYNKLIITYPQLSTMMFARVDAGGIEVGNNTNYKMRSNHFDSNVSSVNFVNHNIMNYMNNVYGNANRGMQMNQIGFLNQSMDPNLMPYINNNNFTHPINFLNNMNPSATGKFNK